MASGVEKLALYELVAEFTTANPEIDFIDASVPVPTGAARAAIAARLEAGNPPDTFQATAGAALTDYVGDGRLQDLISFFAENGLTDAYRADLLESISVDGRIILGASRHPTDERPLGEQRAAAGGRVDPDSAPADVDAWLADLEKVRASGVDYPLALGDASTQVQLFESVLLADLGAARFENLWQSSESWEGAGVGAAIAHHATLSMRRSRRRFDDSVEATQTVVVGHAAYVVLADRPRGLQARRLHHQLAVFGAPRPGTEGLHLDRRLLHAPRRRDPRRGDARVAAHRRHAAGQQALSDTSGSIPARIDTAKEGYRRYQQGAIASLQTHTVVPSIAFGVAARPSWTWAIMDAAVKFGMDGHPRRSPTRSSGLPRRTSTTDSSRPPRQL